VDSAIADLTVAACGYSLFPGIQIPHNLSAFWDTSALLPLFCRDSFSARSRGLLRKYSTIVVWWGTPVEIDAAVSRLQREGQITVEGVQIVLTFVAELRQRWREILPVDRVGQLAEEICLRYGIRSADALQLAAALVWC
jgi:predicted nucleic acid-binding protein